MKSLRLFAVAALFGAFFMSCEAESLNEDQQQIENIEILSSTGDKVDNPIDEEEEEETGN